jgi:hypothetical protein
VTVRPITTPAEIKSASLELTAAVNRLSELPACHLSWEFTEDVPLGRSLDLIDRCNACPVLTECRAVADLTPTRDKKHVVMAGVRYGAKGRPVDLTAEVRRQERDLSLLAAVEFQAAS